MKTLLFAFLLFLAPDWSSGKLLSYELQTVQVQSGNKSIPNTTYSVQIDAGDRIYFAERTLRFAWQKFPRVTENGPIRWALKGNDLRLLDDRGKEFTLTITKTRLK